MTMKCAALVLLALVAAVSADRALLAHAPTPAPAPSPLTATAAVAGPKKAPGAGCVGEAALFQTGCSQEAAALNKATGGKVVATTQDQINALVAQYSFKPSATCCAAAKTMLADACVCDKNVQALAKSAQGLSPSDFQTVGKVFLIACGLPLSTDTCDLASA